MSDSIPEFTESIQWPEDINEQRFLDEYWQKKPLLIRNAFSNFESPLPADELAGLSLETDTTAKIITRDNDGAYHLEYGPFDENRFDSLTGNNWSLLVTDIEKLIPQFASYLQPFRFIPDWRIDDLMISYAPDRASVGAHIDEYDVFLLQGTGVRTWSIDERKGVEHSMRSDGDLKILNDFHASNTWDLNVGDMLYLPPQLPHHGVAKGDECTTWSIGFRSPRMPDILARMAELISESEPAVRYTDGLLTPAVPGELSDATLRIFRNYWDKTTALSDHEFALLLGCCLTESNAVSEPFITRKPLPSESKPADRYTLMKSPFSQFAWRALPNGTAVLFVDGASFDCSSVLAQAICAAPSVLDVKLYDLDTDEQALLTSLTEAGSLLPCDENAT